MLQPFCKGFLCPLVCLCYPQLPRSFWRGGRTRTGGAGGARGPEGGGGQAGQEGGMGGGRGWVHDSGRVGGSQGTGEHSQQSQVTGRGPPGPVTSHSGHGASHAGYGVGGISTGGAVGSVWGGLCVRMRPWQGCCSSSLTRRRFRIPAVHRTRPRTSVPSFSTTRDKRRIPRVVSAAGGAGGVVEGSRGGRR